MGTRQSHPSPSFIQGHSTIEMSEKMRGEDLSILLLYNKKYKLLIIILNMKIKRRNLIYAFENTSTCIFKK